MKTQKYSPHIFALCALAVLQPLYTASNLWLVIISAVLSSVFLLLFCPLVNFGTKNKAALYVAVLLSGVAAIYGAVTAFVDYIKFLKSVQLPQINLILLSVTLAAVIVIFAKSQNHAIYKYCLLISVAVIVMLTICFLGGIKNFDFDLLKVGFEKPRFSLTYFLRQVAFVAAIPIFVFVKTQSLPTKTILSGVWAGFLLLAICTAQGVLTLGAAHYDYSYLHAVSVISSGTLFTRLDGFVYFMFFAATTIRITICVKVAIKAIKNI